jgi:drug/metabolite transporter (DMT)-like permease
MWIAITLFAAFAQTVRNAAQRHLVGDLGTLGATLVRFLYGVPFAIAWLIAVAAATQAWPIVPPVAFFAWCLLGGLAQVAGTALLLRTMRERNFAVGVAYSKSEIVQVALFSFVLVGERLDAMGMAAVATGTLGVLLLAPVDRARPIASLMEGVASRSALLGIASGSTLGLSAVAFGAATKVGGTPSWLVNAALTVVTAQALQTLLLGGWLWWRSREILVRTLRAWRVSLFAGFMGATASAAWFTAFALQSVTYVRVVGLTEMLWSYLVSRRFFREHITAREALGMLLIVVAVVVIAVGSASADPTPRD